ncbi:MAG: antitoxin [Leucobacter sp.]
MAQEDLSKQAGDLVNKGVEFISQNASQINEALHGEQAENISDKVLDAAEELANKVTGGTKSDTIAEVRANIDKKIGND